MRALLACLILLFACAAPASAPLRPARPNIVIVFFDDMGWGDWAGQGAREHDTPNIERLAAEGTRFTDFYVPQPVCTPSRAALLTGSHPKRLGLGYRVIFPYSRHGLAPEEITLAESLGAAGYATGCFGKWHLGHLPAFLPTRAGFDVFEGIPYSNDMDAHYYTHNDFQSSPLPLYRGEQVVEESPDQAGFSARFTDAAIEFMGEHRAEPFFVYLAQPMPHRPLAASEAWRGRSAGGLYGDVIEELDSELGRLAEAIEELGLTGQTLLLVTSDNGPWRQASSGLLRGKKTTTWEGGVRVPCFVRWPGVVPAGRVSDAPWSVLDVAPTVEALTGAPPPALERDGLELVEFLCGASSPPAERVLAFYREDRLQALRRGRWKLHVYVPSWEGELRAPLLFDLERDPGEERDVAFEHPELVAELQGVAAEIRTELGDALTGTEGRGVREVGRE